MSATIENKSLKPKSFAHSYTCLERYPFSFHAIRRFLQMWLHDFLVLFTAPPVSRLRCLLQVYSLSHFATDILTVNIRTKEPPPSIHPLYSSHFITQLFTFSHLLYRAWSPLSSSSSFCSPHIFLFMSFSFFFRICSLASFPSSFSSYIYGLCSSSLYLSQHFLLDSAISVLSSFASPFSFSSPISSLFSFPFSTNQQRVSRGATEGQKRGSRGAAEGQ